MVPPGGMIGREAVAPWWLALRKEENYPPSLIKGLQGRCFLGSIITRLFFVDILLVGLSNNCSIAHL